MTQGRGFVIPDREGHWYDLDGNPVYQIPKKSSEGMKAPTVADAREMNLVPSVSGILDMLYKPGLARWINYQYILSALTLPKLDGESQDDFAIRVVSDAREYSGMASQYGTNFHDLVYRHLNGELEGVALGPEETILLESFNSWAKNHDLEAISLESTHADPVLRFGGRLDFLGFVDGHYALIDWKTQATKPGVPVNFYPEWNPQLSGYGRLVWDEGNEDPPWKINVVFSSTEPGRSQSCVWFDDPDVGDWGWDTFLALHRVYYSPLGPGWKLLRRKDDREVASHFGESI